MPASSSAQPPLGEPITGELIKVIAGQLPEHGDGYYRARIEVLEQRLKEGGGDVGGRIELAAAYLELGRFEQAETAFLGIEADFPELYETQANLAVLYKKTGDYRSAIERAGRAEGLRPDGRLEPGRYYLQMLRWIVERAEKRLAGREVTHDFLGIAYADGAGAAAAHPGVDQDRLLALIRIEPEFSDAFLVLGDVLFAKGDLQHAARAYYQVERIGERETGENAMNAVVAERMDLLENEWRRRAAAAGGLVFDRDYRERILEEFRDATRWVYAFMEVETEMAGTDSEEEFAAVEAEMEKRGIEAPRYLPRGVRGGANTGGIGKDTPFPVILVMGSALFVGFCLLVWWRVRVVG